MIGALKIVAEIAVSVGTSTVVTHAVRQVTPDNLGKIRKICVPIASFAISGAVSKAASNYVNEQIDDMNALVTGVKSELEDKK